jgi:hypothetical protein
MEEGIAQNTSLYPSFFFCLFPTPLDSDFDHRLEMSTTTRNTNSQSQGQKQPTNQTATNNKNAFIQMSMTTHWGPSGPTTTPRLSPSLFLRSDR